MLEKSRPGIHALRVEIQGERDDVDVARALAIAEQRAFDAIGAGHQSRVPRQRRRCRGRCADAG